MKTKKQWRVQYKTKSGMNGVGFAFGQSVEEARESFTRSQPDSEIVKVDIEGDGIGHYYEMPKEEP